MALPYPPPWQDKQTLCEHICISERTVDAWVKMGLLPPPRLRGGKLFWKWSDVDRYIDFGGGDMPASDANNQQEAIRAATKRASNASRRT